MLFGRHSSLFEFCTKWLVIRANVGSFFFSSYWNVTLPVISLQSASVTHRLTSVNKMDALIASSRTLGHYRFRSASSALSSELIHLNHLQPILRLPASLRSVRSLWGITLCLQIQCTNIVSQSHKSRLHGGLETFRTALCPVCLQTPEGIKQRRVNSFTCQHVTVC